MIRGEDDKPVTGATVALIPDSKRYALYMSIATDQNGAFSLRASRRATTNCWPGKTSNRAPSRTPSS